MRGLRWGVQGGVEVAAERDGVIGIALQRPDSREGAPAAVRVCGLQRVGDGLGQQRVCADLDEGVVGAVRAVEGMRDGLLEAHRVAHIGGPVLGVENRLGRRVFVSGGDDRNGWCPRGEIGQFRTHPGLQRIHGRIVRGHFDIHPAGEAVLGPHPGDQLVDLSGGPGDHGLARGVVDPQSHLRVVGDERFGLRGVEAEQGHATLPGQRGHQPRTGGGDPQSLGGGEGSGDHGSGHLAHGVADHQVGLHPVGAPQLGQCQLHADEAQLDLLDADQFLAIGEHVVQREAGLRDENRLQFGDRGGESGLVGEQSATHPGPLRSAAGVDEHRARPGRAVPGADHAGGVLPGRQGTQPGHRLGAFAGDHDAVLGVPGPVVIQRVGHVGQRHRGARAVHPVGQHGRRDGHPLRRLAGHQQRRHLGAGIGVGFRAGFSAATRYRNLFGTLLDDDVRVGPAQSE